VPTAEVQVLLSAGELPLWTLEFHVKFRDGTPASGYWVHLYDVDEPTGLSIQKDWGYAQVDENGVAVFTGIGGAWALNRVFDWVWYENRFKVEILTPDKSQVVKSFDLWLDHQWPYPVGGQTTAPGQVPEISEHDRDWYPKEVDP